MANPLAEAQANMPQLVKPTKVPVLLECPICFTGENFPWSDHTCSQTFNGTDPDQLDAHLALEMYQTAMKDFESLFEEKAHTMTVTAMELEMTNLGGNNVRKCVEAISDAAHGLGKVTTLIGSVDQDARKLAAYLSITKVRHGFSYELTGGALMLISAHIPDADEFLLNFTIAMEVSTWAMGGLAGFPDPFAMEPVSLQHRAVRQELVDAGCHFIAPFLATSSDRAKVVQFLEANRPANVFEPPLILPLSDDEDMPLGRGWSASLQFLVKLRALLNLRDIARVRVVCSFLPEELVRFIQREIAEGLVRSNADIMHAIQTGQNLSPCQLHLTDQLRTLMCAMKEEPAFNEVLLSIANDELLAEHFNQELQEKLLLRGEIMRISRSQMWIRAEYHATYVLA